MMCDVGSDAIHEGQWWLASSRSRNLVLSLLRQCLPHVDSIRDSECEDVYLWQTANKPPSPTFSASLMWDTIHPRSETIYWHKAVWFKDHIPRHAFGCWVVARNQMITRDRLIRWGLSVSSLCLLCNVQNENRQHLFFDCPFSAEIWLSYTVAANLSPPPLFEDLLRWIVKPNQEKNLNIIMRILFHATIQSRP
ncbi:unnamed protein product [Microthlaspi erraticum]|uniref:Reverse transcriptase zinc-binding domain-containing protein n=1 Tax=Microthlaspi erraticum TaxID=1685480 RepID=A0A6D2KP39_9BRAS|nr:unnamed protein product [Microthlaspi erraticum]